MFFCFFFQQDHQPVHYTFNSLCRPPYRLVDRFLSHSTLRFREIEVSTKHWTLNGGSDTKTSYPGLESLQGAAGLWELSMSMLLAQSEQEDIDFVLSARGKDEQSPAIWYFQWAQTMCTNHRHSSAWAWQLLHLWSHFAALEPHIVIDSNGIFWMGYGVYVLIVFYH